MRSLPCWPGIASIQKPRLQQGIASGRHGRPFFQSRMEVNTTLELERQHWSSPPLKQTTCYSMLSNYSFNDRLVPTSSVDGKSYILNNMILQANVSLSLSFCLCGCPRSRLLIRSESLSQRRRGLLQHPHHLSPPKERNHPTNQNQAEPC